MTSGNTRSKIGLEFTQGKIESKWRMWTSVQSLSPGQVSLPPHRSDPAISLLHSFTSKPLHLCFAREVARFPWLVLSLQTPSLCLNICLHRLWGILPRLEKYKSCREQIGFSCAPTPKFQIPSVLKLFHFPFLLPILTTEQYPKSVTCHWDCKLLPFSEVFVFQNQLLF